MTTPSTETRPSAGRANLPFDAAPIRTERFVLRPFQASDLTGVHAEQTREEVLRHLLWETRAASQVEVHLAEESTRLCLELDGDCLVFAVELPNPEGGKGRVVGDMRVSLENAESAQFEIGWAFHPAFHRPGYATEAVRAILDLCFSTLQAHRVFARLDPQNGSAVSLCDQLGMRREAHLRENLLPNGEWGDTLVYGLLSGDRPESAVSQGGLTPNGVS